MQGVMEVARSKLLWTPDTDIYVINTDGSGLVRLSHDPAYDGHPDWSSAP